MNLHLTSLNWVFYCCPFWFITLKSTEGCMVVNAYKIKCGDAYLQVIVKATYLRTYWALCPVLLFYHHHPDSDTSDSEWNTNLSKWLRSILSVFSRFELCYFNINSLIGKQRDMNNLQKLNIIQYKLNDCIIGAHSQSFNLKKSCTLKKPATERNSLMNIEL